MSLTPEQFDKLVTKDEFNEFKDEMMDMKKDVKRILNSVDGIAHKHQKFEVEMTANVGAHDRFEKKFSKTNVRVEILEKKLGVSQIAA
jgi:hypothetical protein